MKKIAFWVYKVFVRNSVLGVFWQRISKIGQKGIIDALLKV